MKGLKKLALVSAMTVASLSAQAELKALDDSVMGEMTGQAGLTIELQTNVSVGEIKYTDTDGHASDTTAGAGSFSMKGLKIAGADFATGQVAGNLDDLKIDIDIASDGDAVIHVGSVSGNPIDFGISLASAELSGTVGTDTTTLLSNLTMVGNLLALDIRVDTATDTLTAAIGFRVENLNADIPFLAVGIRGMTITSDGSAGITPAAMAGYGAAYAVMEMGAADRNGDGTNDALKIGIAAFEADINIASVELGGTSIGSVAINDLVITNTEMLVYGH